jgi:hypothetical protein
LIDAVEPGNYVRLHPFNYTSSTDMDLFIPSRLNIGLAAGANGYKLCVDGKIIAEELRVQMSGEWPDYVFDTHYPLSSLEEIEQYIQSHHHLPNLPSAREVMEEGLLVGDMQARLLEKIEELTLHIIRQEKELKSLQAEVEFLKNK